MPARHCIWMRCGWWRRPTQNGGEITAQIFPRPIGLVLGLGLSGHPFVLYPSYRELAHLPLAERVAEMRKPEVRERILNDTPAGDGHPLMFAAQAFEWMFPLEDPPNYEPDRSDSIAERARARGVSPLEEAYDRVLDDDGQAMLMVTLANFRDGSLDTVAELIRRDDVVLGLGDGGAHYGMICDASFPTYMLTHWVRDRADGPTVGGRDGPGADLGAGPGRRARRSRPHHRRLQGRPQRHRRAAACACTARSSSTICPPADADWTRRADGYVATIVSGEIIAENGVPTDARPGRLVRGRRPLPA